MRIACQMETRIAGCFAVELCDCVNLHGLSQAMQFARTQRQFARLANLGIDRIQPVIEMSGYVGGQPLQTSRNSTQSSPRSIHHPPFDNHRVFGFAHLG